MIEKPENLNIGDFVIYSDKIKKYLCVGQIFEINEIRIGLYDRKLVFCSGKNFDLYAEADDGIRLDYDEFEILVKVDSPDENFEEFLI